MARRLCRFSSIAVVAMTGCLPTTAQMEMVPQQAFAPNSVVQPTAQTTSSAAPTEVAMRVAMTGQKIITANPQLGVRPLFRTIGAPDPEVFHRGTEEINVTEGLVTACTTEGQLAAVLCTELAKMVGEQQMLALGDAIPEERPPIPVQVGNDAGRMGTSSDQTDLVEIARWERRKKERKERLTTAPDPRLLARTLLTNSGFPPAELDTVQPILQTAAAKGSLEKQLNAPPKIERPWARP